MLKEGRIFSVLNSKNKGRPVSSPRRGIALVLVILCVLYMCMAPSVFALDTVSDSNNVVAAADGSSDVKAAANDPDDADAAADNSDDGNSASDNADNGNAASDDSNGGKAVANDQADSNTAADESDNDSAQKTSGTLEATCDEYTVTVTYDEDAKLPENAELAVKELSQDSDVYSKYEKKSNKETESLDAADADGNSEVSRQCRIFDVKIMSGDQEIEPAAGVTVKFDFRDGTELNADTAVVHFADKGTELLSGKDLTVRTKKSGEGSIEFELDSFSLITISTTPSAANPTNNWKVTPESGKSYVIFYWDSDNFYAIDGNGNRSNALTVNWADGNVSFASADLTNGRIGSDYMWSVTTGSTNGSLNILNMGSNKYLEPNSLNSNGLAGWTNSCKLDGSASDGYFIKDAPGNGNYIRIVNGSTKKQGGYGTVFYFAEVTPEKYTGDMT